jgi:hypothetical protein
LDAIFDVAGKGIAENRRIRIASGKPEAAEFVEIPAGVSFPVRLSQYSGQLCHPLAGWPIIADRNFIPRQGVAAAKAGGFFRQGILNVKQDAEP